MLGFDEGMIRDCRTCVVEVKVCTIGRIGESVHTWLCLMRLRVGSCVGFGGYERVFKALGGRLVPAIEVRKERRALVPWEQSPGHASKYPCLGYCDSSHKGERHSHSLADRALKYNGH